MQPETKEKQVISKYSLEEYSALRNEIVSTMEQSRNIWITMITLYVTLFVVAMQTHSLELLLLTYIILIPFQNIINAQQWSVQKISTYIRCFFENENTGIHWETLHVFPPYLDYRKKYGDEKITNTISSLLLGFLSSSLFVGIKIHSYIQKLVVFNFIEFLWLMLSVVLFVVLAIIYSKYYNRYEDDLMDVFTEYKKSIHHK